MKFSLIAAIIILFSFSFVLAEHYVEVNESFEVDREYFKLDVDIDAGEVKIMRGDESNVCHVFLKYTKDRCEADMHFDEKRNELKINMDVEGMKFWDSDKRGDVKVEVVIELPTKVEIDFNARIKAGEVKISVGDLFIKNFELGVWAGELMLDFDRPNRIEMETFEVNAKVGEIKLSRLGNANFEEGDINGGIGELTIDFTGEYSKKCMASVDLDIGETTIIVPEDIGVKLRVSKFLFLSSVDYPAWFEKRGKYYYSDNYADEDNSLYLNISQGIGELSIKVD